jgi:hypothetical protein
MGRQPGGTLPGRNVIFGLQIYTGLFINDISTNILRSYGGCLSLTLPRIRNKEN